MEVSSFQSFWPLNYWAKFICSDTEFQLFSPILALAPKSKCICEHEYELSDFRDAKSCIHSKHTHMLGFLHCFGACFGNVQDVLFWEKKNCMPEKKKHHTLSTHECSSYHHFVATNGVSFDNENWSKSMVNKIHAEEKPPPKRKKKPCWWPIKNKNKKQRLFVLKHTQSSYLTICSWFFWGNSLTNYYQFFCY